MEKTNIIVLIDAGHTEKTPGKRSPDGRLREYAWNMKTAQKVKELLALDGIESEIVPQFPTMTDNDDLNSRVRWINGFCRQPRAEKVVVVSIHCNAAGNGTRWYTARGWSCFVAKKCSKDSKRLAKILCESARNAKFKVRQYSETEPWWTGNFAIVRDTVCPAVLVENFFMDNRSDCEYLLTPHSNEECACVISASLKQFRL